MKKSNALNDKPAFPRVFVSILFTTVGLYWPAVFAVSKCYNEGLVNHSAVPRCETVEPMQFPDASKPTAAVFLSLLEQRNYDSVLVTYTAIKKHSPLTQLNIVATRASLKDLEQMTRHCDQDKKACAVSDLIKNSLINVIEIDKPQDYRYLQDFLQFYIKSKVVSLFPTIHPDETKNSDDSNNRLLPKVSISEDVAKACEIPKYNLDILNPTASGKTMGGNLESLPSNVIALGKYKVVQDDENSKFNSMSDAELKLIIKQRYAKENLSDDQISQLIWSFRNGELTSKSFEKKLSGLKVIHPLINLTLSEHVDETFSVIKSNSKCGFSVLIPSPKTAIEIMQRLTVPSDKAKCLNSGGPNLKTSLPKDQSTERNHMEGMCVGFRGKTYDDLLKDSEFLRLNERLESFSQENMNMIREALKNRCENIDFIKIPYLIGKAPWGENELVTPNLVNGLVITPFTTESSIYINNPTFFRPFDEYLVHLLNKRGVNTFFTKDSDYFFGFGGYHCASSTIQLCK